MTNAGVSGLDLLLQRLTWPSGLVRERACVSLGSLMADVEFGAEVASAVLAWMAVQKLESVVVFGLLALFQAKNRGVCIPPWDAVSRQLLKPSLLSWLIARSLFEEPIGDPAVRGMHSGAASAGFEADPFFLRYAKAFVPPVYLEHARHTDTKYSPGFLHSGSLNGQGSSKSPASGCISPTLTFGRARMTTTSSAWTFR